MQGNRVLLAEFCEPIQPLGSLSTIRDWRFIPRPATALLMNLTIVEKDVTLIRRT